MQVAAFDGDGLNERANHAEFECEVQKRGIRNSNRTYAEDSLNQVQ